MSVGLVLNNTMSASAPNSQEYRIRKIKWTDDEENKLAAYVADERLRQPVPAMATLLNQAQEKVLPASRWRSLATINQAGNVLVKINKLLAEKISKLAEVVENSPEIQVVEVKVPEPVDYNQLLKSLSAPEIASLLVEKFSSRLSAIEEKVGVEKPITKPSASASAPADRPDRPPTIPLGATTSKQKIKIAVVGLFHDQFRHAEDKVQGRPVELVFIDKEKSATKFPTVDYVIVQKHSRHRWYESARDKFSSRNVFFIDGGITQVVQKIYDISSMQRA